MIWPFLNYINANILDLASLSHSINKSVLSKWINKERLSIEFGRTNKRKTQKISTSCSKKNPTPFCTEKKDLYILINRLKFHFFHLKAGLHIPFTYAFSNLYNVLYCTCFMQKIIFEDVGPKKQAQLQTEKWLTHITVQTKFARR